MTRMLLFVATNFAILFVLNISLRILGVDRMLETQGGGINMTALLAVSTGLLANMSVDEAEAVLGHEVSHHWTTASRRSRRPGAESGPAGDASEP